MLSFGWCGQQSSAHGDDSFWRVVYEEAPLVRDFRQCLAPGIVPCATWEGAGHRGTRVFGVSRRGVLCLSRNPALNLRVKISFWGVQSCTDGMDLTGQDGDLVPPEPPAGTPSPGPDRDPPSAPSAPLVQNEDASKWCRVATVLSHDSVLNAAANGQLSQQDGAHLIAGLCGLYGMDWMSQPTVCLLSLKAPCFLTFGNRMRGFDAREQGWVLVQRRRQRCSQGHGKKVKESEVKKSKFCHFKPCVPGRKESFF